MANKREFKKFIAEVAGSVCTEMSEVYYNVEGVDKDGVEKALAKILTSGEAAIRNSNTRYDRGLKSFNGNQEEYRKAKKAFFKSLFKRINSDFSTALDEGLKTFNAAVPEDAKKANIE